MSPKKPVNSLQNKCLNIVYNRLVYAIADEDTKGYKLIRKYLTRAALENFLRRMLKSQNLDAGIRFNCLQLLLTLGGRELDTGEFPRFYYDKILVAICDWGQRLQHLNLKGVWVRDFPELLSQVIRKLVVLKSLVIPYMANDEVIDAIATLEKLTVLDISGESGFTVNGILKLNSDRLQVLDIGLSGCVSICQEDDQEEPELDEYEDDSEELEEFMGEDEDLEEITGYTEKDLNNFQLLADILVNLPNLLSLGTYSYIGNALMLIHDSFPNYKMNLEYLYDTGTNRDVIESILCLCPKLKSIHLNASEVGVVEKLVELENLTTLKVTKCDIDDVFSYLKLSGTQLQDLKLYKIRNITVDITDICEFAPNLQTLEFCQIRVNFRSANCYFRNLENVEFNYCDLSTDCIENVIKSSVVLKMLIVTGAIVRLTDNDIMNFCSELKLQNLEKLWFSSAKSLTAQTIEILLEHCPNLVQVGELDRWDISRDEVLDLRALIKCKNIDLTIIPT